MPSLLRMVIWEERMGLHRVAVQRPGLVGEEEVGQPAVHPVVGIGEGGVFVVVEQAGDLVPVDFEPVGQQGGNLDDFPHRQPQLGGELVIGGDREEAGKPRLGQHADEEHHRRIKGLEILPGDLQQGSRVEPAAVLPAEGAEDGEDQEPGVILQAVVHGAEQIRVNHQPQQPFHLADGLAADNRLLVLAVRDAKPGLRLLFDIGAHLPVIRLDAPCGIAVGSGVLNHRRSTP